MDVCPLSRRVTFKPVSDPLRPKVMPFGTDRPSLFPSSCARTPMGSPCGSLSPTGRGRVRGCHVPLIYPDRLGAACTPVARHLRQRTLEPLYLTTYLLVQACQHLWLDKRCRCLQRFTCVHHTTRSLLLTALVLAELRSPYGFLSWNFFRGLLCPGSFTPGDYSPRMSR